MSELARRQEELVLALVAGGPLPDGFDATPVEAARAALMRKRAAETARHLPFERAELGDRFGTLFARWAQNRPKTNTGSDAAGFRRHLYESGELRRPDRQGIVRRLLRRRGSGL